MTLNINYDKPSLNEWAARKTIIVDTINTEKPDIIALQAVCKDTSQKSTDQSIELAKALDYPHVWYQPAVHKGKRTEGSAILAKIQIDDKFYAPLSLIPGLDDTNHRIVIHCSFKYHDRSFHLFNAHFSWVEEQNKRNITETLHFLHTVEGPSLLCGDLNAPGTTNWLKPLQDDGWIDIWLKLKNEEGFTFPSNNPSIRIDYVWANKKIQEGIRSIKVTANEPDNTGRYASDHYGLLVAFEI